MDEFNKETNKAHDAESNGCGNCNLLEFTAIWLCASFHQSDGIFGEQTARFTEFDNLIHVCRLIAEITKKNNKNIKNLLVIVFEIGNLKSISMGNDNALE